MRSKKNTLILTLILLSFKFSDSAAKNSRENNHAGATNHPACTEVARGLLLSDPSVPLVHVGIAAMLCEGVANPMDSGLGGGFQALVRLSNGSAYHVVAREKSPRDSHFLSSSVTGGNAIGVPSAMYGYAHLLGIDECFRQSSSAWRTSRRHETTSTAKSATKSRARNKRGEQTKRNSQTWSSIKRCALQKISLHRYGNIVKPSRDMACMGFEPSRILVEMYAMLPRISFVAPLEIQNFSRISPNRSSHSQRHTTSYKVRNPALCRLLTHLAKHPVNLIRPYVAKKSALREAMLRDFRASGSKLTAKDFAEYRPSRFPVRPIKISSKYEAFAPGQPSSSRVVAFFAASVAALRGGQQNSASSKLSRSNIDAYLALMRDAASLRIYNREGYSNNKNLTQSALYRVQKAITGEFGRKRDGLTRQFDSTNIFPRIYVTETTKSRAEPIFLGGTSNVVFARGEREVFVATSSINHRFGSMTLSRSLGIPYNDQLRDFIPETWTFGKTKKTANRKSVFREKISTIPPSSMSPIILASSDQGQRTLFAGGASGGPKIPVAMAATLWQVMNDKTISLSEAIARERLTVTVYVAKNRTETWLETPRSQYGRDVANSLRKIAEDRGKLPRLKERVGVRYGPRAIRHTLEAGYSAVTAVSRITNDGSGQRDSIRAPWQASHDIRRGGSAWTYD